MRYSLNRWEENAAICPLTCLQAYVEKTSSLRSTHNKDRLFVGSTKPHNPVTSSTVGRWIKEQLKEAGIDTSVFSAHSTRGAGASKASSAGVSIQSILNQGHWANESTFSKFYRRETTSELNLVESAVLAGMNSASDWFNHLFSYSIS
jgi:site-specific recombinase XerD